ncbi:Leucine-rich repeats and immunoglobulin-like domains protein 3 [Merluccius polli]|nr:Leucine-rich repeats and immunoglobulin-like domains protein 3 [Merluccius polli]
MSPRTQFAGLFLLLLLGVGLSVGYRDGTGTCPPLCTCSGELVDCGRVRRGKIPETVPERTVQLDLSHNKLQVLHAALFSNLPHLKEIKLNNNELERIPDFGSCASNITTLILANNRISRIWPEQLQPLLALETLDLSSNNMVDIRADSFPLLPLRNLILNANRISSLEPGCFVNLSSTLQVLKLNRNRLSTIPAKIFQLPNLLHLELSRNRIRKVEGLTFQGLHALRSLKMQRNAINRLMDGALWGLSNMEVLHLDYNNLTEVSKGWLYGLHHLQHLHLAHNAIVRIRPHAWEFCQNLQQLDLSSTHLARLEEASFSGLSLLDELHLGDNRISFIADGAFRGLSHLQTLDLQNNEISWTIEDMNGPFSALDKLKKLFLQGNRIRSVTKKSFSGLDTLEHLDLSDNAIMSIQGNAFSQMKKLEELHLNTSSLLCDCQIKWLPSWVAERAFLPYVNASCAHPQMLKGMSVFAVGQDEFVCDDFPKPQITVQPDTQSAIKGTNVTFVCSAASSSDSPMTFAWKKDNEALDDAEIHNQAHLRAQGGAGMGPGGASSTAAATAAETEVTEYTTTLRLRDVDFSSEGRYQCVISNHFGSSYSTKAKLTVNILPSFTKTPMDLSIRAGATARLECAAVGHPSPQIAWQKDGGTDFPAARERRMHVMPEDDVFFIVDVKTEDIGVYSCTAQNTAGAISANATLTVLETPSFLRPLRDRTVSKGETAVLQCIAGGSPPPRLNWTKDDGPLVVTERHFFAAANQLLIIVDAAEADAGRYTCEMSNALGTERGDVRLAVLPVPNCDSLGGVGGAGGGGLAIGGVSVGGGPDDDGWNTVGIVIIAVVCCVVGTSLVWVVIIYHTRRRSEDCSVTNTDETNLPADIPSYLSSQGTLADRQDVYIPSESGSSHQYLASSMSGFYIQQKDMNGLCHVDTGSEADMEAALDPLLCHYQGPIGSLLRREHMLPLDQSEAFTGCAMDQRAVLVDSYSGSLGSSKCREYFPCGGVPADPFDHPSSGVLMQLSSATLHFGLPYQNVENRPPSVDDENASDYGRPHERATPSKTFMGTFGKTPRRPKQEPRPGFVPPGPTGAPAHRENLYAALDTDSEREDSGRSRSDSGSEGNSGVYEQPFRRAPLNPSRPAATDERVA